jgi:hypothetical protein
VVNEADASRKFVIWFVHKAYPVDMAKVREIFIDATYSTSRSNTHFYAIVAEELGYSIPVGFMIMEIHEREDTRTSKHAGEAKECNRTFYAAAKRLGLEPHTVHTDKDFSEINAAKVCPPLPISCKSLL